MQMVHNGEGGGHNAAGAEQKHTHTYSTHPGDESVGTNGSSEDPDPLASQQRYN